MYVIFLLTQGDNYNLIHSSKSTDPNPNPTAKISSFSSFFFFFQTPHPYAVHIARKSVSLEHKAYQDFKIFIFQERERERERVLHNFYFLLVVFFFLNLCFPWLQGLVAEADIRFSFSPTFSENSTFPEISQFFFSYRLHLGWSMWSR